MTLCTLSALLLASPFAADLLDLTTRLVPRLLEAARLIQEFRAAGPTPEGAARFEQALQRLAREVCREVVAWVYNRLEPDDPARMPAQLGWQGEWYRRRVKSANRALATLFGAVPLWRYRYEPLEAGQLRWQGEQRVSHIVAKHHRIPQEPLENLPYCQRRARVVGRTVYYGGRQDQRLLQTIRQALGDPSLVFAHDHHEKRLREDVLEFRRLLRRHRSA